MKNEEQSLLVSSKVCAACLLILLCFAFTVHAASFDCKKSLPKVEKLICENAELSNLDEKLSQQYQQYFKDTKKPQQIRREQLQWLKERNRCESAECLTASYVKRRAYLAYQRAAEFKLDVAKKNLQTLTYWSLRSLDGYMLFTIDMGDAICGCTDSLEFDTLAYFIIFRDVTDLKAYFQVSDLNMPAYYSSIPYDVNLKDGVLVLHKPSNAATRGNVIQQSPKEIREEGLMMSLPSAVIDGKRIDVMADDNIQIASHCLQQLRNFSIRPVNEGITK